MTPDLRDGDLDPRTPVVVGVGQSSERLQDPDYRRRSPVDLAADAAREALGDSGTDLVAVAAAVDTLAATRQFENSTPGARAPLGRSDNFPRSVALRIGASPRWAILEAPALARQRIAARIRACAGPRLRHRRG